MVCIDKKNSKSKLQSSQSENTILDKKKVVQYSVKIIKINNKSSPFPPITMLASVLHVQLISTCSEFPQHCIGGRGSGNEDLGAKSHVFKEIATKIL